LQGEALFFHLLFSPFFANLSVVQFPRSISLQAEVSDIKIDVLLIIQYVAKPASPSRTLFDFHRAAKPQNHP
jgi:hypothetical protein